MYSHSHSHTLYTMKLCIVNLDNMLKFGSLETLCVDRRSKKQFKLSHYMYTSNLGLCTHIHTANFSTLCLYTMKLCIVNLDTKAKAMLKFGSLETLCVDRRLKKRFKLSHYMYTSNLGLFHALKVREHCLYSEKLYIIM